MYKFIVLILFFSCTALLWSQLNWQNTFFSGQLPDQSVVVRTQAAAGSSVELLSKGTAGVQFTPMNSLNDGYDNHQIQVPIPAYPFLGFRSITGSTTEILPVFHNSTAIPAVNELTSLFDDPLGDCAFTNTNLDIVKTSATFTNDKLYFSIKNAGGGFPVSSGFTFFAYMIALVNPEANTADTLVFALMHTVTISDIIGPGLYKLTGSATTDMTLIGPIITTTYAADNTLLLSCNLSDLMADPDFSNWYNPADPKLGFGAMTNRITLSIGTEVADQTSSCNLILYPIQIDQTTASLPVLTDIQTSIVNDTDLLITLNYQSPEAYLPVTDQILFDTGFMADFIPAAFPDFDNPVSYAAQINLPDIQGWSFATLRFSTDGANYTNNLIYPTAVSDAALNPVTPMVNIYPNPTNGCFYIDTRYAKTPLTIRLYDIKGRKLDELVTCPTNSNRIITYDLNSLSQRTDGIYILKMEEGGRTTTRKITLIK